MPPPLSSDPRKKRRLYGGVRRATTHRQIRELTQLPKYCVGLAPEHRYYAPEGLIAKAQQVIARCESLLDAYIFSDGSVEPPLYTYV